MAPRKKAVPKMEDLLFENCCVCLQKYGTVDEDMQRFVFLSLYQFVGSVVNVLDGSLSSNHLNIIVDLSVLHCYGSSENV